MTSSETSAAVDVAARENEMTVSVTATGRYRSEIDLELAKRYARDVHGVLDARFPGIGMYRQHQVASRSPVRSDLFRPIPGIEQERDPTRQLHGVALILFRDQEAHEATSSSRLLELAREDNLVLTELNFHYIESEPGRGRTYLDRTGWEGTPQGPVEYPTFASFFRRQRNAPREAFDAYMRALAQRWSAHEGVLRVRLDLLSDVESQFEYEPDDLVQAWIDLVLADESAAKDLIGPDDGLDHAAHVEGIQAIEISDIFTLVFDEKPTHVGLRGWPAVQTIDEIGAHAQNNPELLELLYGPVVRGTRHVTGGHGG
jgi:hypothetical protein